VSAKLSTPVAIVVGSIIIAGALYLGLRERAAPPTTTTASAVLAPPATPTRVPVTVKPDDVRRRVLAELARHRKTIVESCAPDGGAAAFTFEYTFAADGRQLGRGVIEDRGTGNPETTACVLKSLPALKLEPIGRSAKTTVRFELP
jgi:hypothetical protein